MPLSEPKQIEDQKSIRVRRGKVDSVDLYEIKDSELDQLERGSPADIQLNFAIFLLSVAFSAICSLLTAKFENYLIQITFIVVTVVGIIVGGYLLLSWSRARSSLRNVYKRIRERIPPDITPPQSEDLPIIPAKDSDQPVG